MTGETFHNCVIRYKMKTAAQEIRKGEKSMTEIALELGYDNFTTFPSCSERSTDVHRESFKKKDEKMSDLFRTFFMN